METINLELLTQVITIITGIIWLVTLALVGVHVGRTLEAVRLAAERILNDEVHIGIEEEVDEEECLCCKRYAGSKPENAECCQLTREEFEARLQLGLYNMASEKLSGQHRVFTANDRAGQSPAITEEELNYIRGTSLVSVRKTLDSIAQDLKILLPDTGRSSSVATHSEEKGKPAQG